MYITGAITYAPGIGHGHGPVEHFWQWKQIQQKVSLQETKEGQIQ